MTKNNIPNHNDINKSNGNPWNYGSLKLFPKADKEFTENVKIQIIPGQPEHNTV